MSQFQFYENCTFCQSRIGSTHCLLPYQLVRIYQPPRDEISRVMDITEIHMRYGLEMLTSNLQSIDWIKARPYSRQQTTPSVFSDDKPVSWFDQVNDQIRSQDNPSTNLTTHSDDNQSISYSDFISGQLDATILESSSENGAPVMEEALVLTTSIPKADSDIEPPLVPPFVPSKVTKGKQPVSEEPEHYTSSASKDSDPIYSQDHKNHLIQDLVISIKTAFNIHHHQRGGIRTNVFKESLMNESNIRSMTGAKYKPSRNTSLDGNKALAKELISIHSPEELQHWECSNSNERGSYCILNMQTFTLPFDESNQSKLGEDLVYCAIKLLQMKTRKMGLRDAIIEAVKFDLKKDGFPSAFEWINNRFTYLSNRKQRSESYDSELQRATPAGKKVKEPYPLVDSKLVDYVNINLQVIVNRKIESFGEDVPTMSDATKLSKFLYKLASEFFFRNQGWHNENSFTLPQHLTRIEETSGLKSKPSESILTFKILKEIIDDFRRMYKKRIVPRYLIE
jgi:hypothetical protein